MGCHFMCNKRFPDYVMQKAREDLHLIRHRNAEIRCGFPGCRATPWEDWDIAKRVDSEVFKAYQKSKGRMREEQLKEQVKEEHEMQLQTRGMLVLPGQSSNSRHDREPTRTQLRYTPARVPGVSGRELPRNPRL